MTPCIFVRPCEGFEGAWCWHCLPVARCERSSFEILHSRAALWLFPCEFALCLSVRTETMRLTQNGFSRNLIFADCSKICRENSGFIKIWQEKGYLIRRRMYIHANISQNCGRNRHILPSMCVCVCVFFFFFENVAAHENTEEAQNAVFRIHWNSGYANTPQCYVIRTLCVFFPSVTGRLLRC